MLQQLLQQLLQVIWQGCVKGAGLVLAGKADCQPGSVQKVTLGGEAGCPAPVDRVSHYRATDKAHVQANLVRSAGQGVNFEQGMERVFLQQAVFGDCLAPFVRLDDCHPFALSRIATDGSFDTTGGGWRVTIYQGQVHFLYLARSKLVLKPALCKVVLGDQDQAGCVFIQPVHDAGSHFAAYPLHFWGVSQGGVNQSAVIMAGCRVYYHPSRFVHYNQIIVFKDHIQGDLFGLQAAGLERRDTQLDLGRLVQHQPGFMSGDTVDGYKPVFD